MKQALLGGLLAIAVLFAPMAKADPNDDASWQPYIDAGKAMAGYLTTVSYQSVDSDVNRILNASINPFHDDFANRSNDFKQVVRNAQSTSTGTVLGAELESLTGSTAKVLNHSHSTHLQCWRAAGRTRLAAAHRGYESRRPILGLQRGVLTMILAPPPG
jgi:hypothetical protein